MAKVCALSTGYLPRGGLPRNSLDRLTDSPDMTSAVGRGRKASTQTNKQIMKSTAKLVKNAKCLFCYVMAFFINKKMKQILLGASRVAVFLNLSLPMCSMMQNL